MHTLVTVLLCILCFQRITFLRTYVTSELRVRLAPSGKIFYLPSKVELLLWIIHVISVLFLLCFYAHLFIVALWSPAGKGLTSWLSIVMCNCEFVTFPLVSWIRCGTSLYRFLIFALFLTFRIEKLKFGAKFKAFGDLFFLN